MLSLAFTLPAGLLAAAGLVAGQIISPCNPVKGADCPPDPAFGGDYFFDFTTATYEDLKRDWNVGSLTPSQVTFDGAKGAGFTIFGDSGAPTLISNKYMFFGKVEVVVQAAPGQGIITCVVLGSDCEDEIDWEWVGSHNYNVETNYYAKPGSTPKYNTYIDRLAVNNPTGSFHTYTLEWTPDWMAFSIDGAELRRAYAKDSSGGADWPQTPMQVRLGSWVGGAPGASQGTIDWAGGVVNPSEAPFVAWFKSVRVTDYSNGFSGASEYIYKDRTGFAQGIQVVGGVANNNPGTGSSPAPATPSSPPPPVPSSSGDAPAKDTGPGPGPATTSSTAKPTPPPSTSSPPTTSTTSTTSSSSATPSTSDSMITSSVHTSTSTTGTSATTTSSRPAQTTSQGAASRTDMGLAALVPLWVGLLVLQQ